MSLKLEPTDARTLAESSPTDLEARCWFYEEPAGLLIVVEHRNAQGWTGTSQHRIGWAQVRRALARLESR